MLSKKILEGLIEHEATNPPNYGIKCWACGIPSAADVGIARETLHTNRTPRAGDFMLCCHCGRLCLVCDDHSTRQPTRAEMNKGWEEDRETMTQICLMSLMVITRHERKAK